MKKRPLVGRVGTPAARPIQFEIGSKPKFREGG